MELIFVARVAYIQAGCGVLHHSAAPAVSPWRGSSFVVRADFISDWTQDISSRLATVLSAGSLMAYMVTFSLGLGAIPWVLMSEVRFVGVGVTVSKLRMRALFRQSPA